MSRKFRKKPVVIDAVLWTGDKACLLGTVFAEHFVEGMIEMVNRSLPIRTLEGTMLANVGDWIIRGVKGECYPCKPDIFAATYEEVTESEGETVSQDKPNYWRPYFFLLATGCLSILFCALFFTLLQAGRSEWTAMGLSMLVAAAPSWAIACYGFPKEKRNG